MSDLFNSRELSLLIWSILAITLMILKPSIRVALIDVIRTFFSKKLVIMLLWMLSYIGLVVYALYILDLWNFGQIKNTLIWIAFTGIGTLFKANKVREDKNFFKNALLDIFKFTAIVEFLVGLYTLNFWMEFIILPISVILSGAIVFAEKDPKNEPVKKLFNSILSLIGLFLMGYTLYKMITEFKTFATIGTFSEFIIPPILSLSFLPFIYLLSVVMSYEVNFIRIKLGLKNPTLEKFARKQAIINFGFHIKDLERWATSLFRIQITNEIEIIDSISEIKRLKKIEKNPPDISTEIGWSPYKAKDFLLSEGIETGYYKDLGEEEWMACSTYIKLDDSFVSNNIAFYVEGNSQIAKKLKLALSVNSPELASEAHLKLLTLASSLYYSALGREIPAELEEAILFGYDSNTVQGNKKIVVAKTEWPEHRLKGYGLNFKITAYTDN